MSHPYIDPLEEFTDQLRSFSPSLLVVGGLQMLENFPFLDGKYSSYFVLEYDCSHYGHTIGQLLSQDFFKCEKILVIKAMDEGASKI